MQRQIFVLVGILVTCFSLICVFPVHAKQYEVKKGENLSSISKKFGVSVQELKQVNNLSTNSLRWKQIIFIPEKNQSISTTIAKSKPKAKAKPQNYYTVKKGDTLSLIAKKTGVPLKQISALNGIKPQNLKVGQKLTLTAFPRVQHPETIEDTGLFVDDDEEIADSGTISLIEDDRSDASELLGKWSSYDERKLLVRIATGFLGAPYRLGGSTIRGIDCSAFVRKIYHFFDVPLPRTAREQSNIGLSVDKDELAEGDLVFFHTRRQFGHVGIYIGNQEFVHASSRDKVVRIDSLESPYFNKRFVRAVRLKGLEEKGA